MFCLNKKNVEMIHNLKIESMLTTIEDEIKESEEQY